MAGYNITEMVQPKDTAAHIESFFTVKNKNLYCILPAYKSQFTIKNVSVNAGTKVSILGYPGQLSFKQKGNECTIDLSALEPGDIPFETFVIKLENAL